MSGTGDARGSASRVPQTPARAQGLLFTEDLPVLDEQVGYRGPTACKAAGITYRQLDYWARTGLVEPSIRSTIGSGIPRLYGFRDVLVLKVVKRLLDTGVSLQQIRIAVGYLRDRGVDDLAQLTLMSDGASVYECTCADEVFDLVQGGQGVFGIAVGRVWREVEGSLAELPGSVPDDVEIVPVPDLPGDELATRRRNAGSRAEGRLSSRPLLVGDGHAGQGMTVTGGARAGNVARTSVGRVAAGRRARAGAGSQDPGEMRVEGLGELLGGWPWPTVDRQAGALGLLQCAALGDGGREDQRPEHVAELGDAVAVLGGAVPVAVHDDAEGLQLRGVRATELVDGAQRPVGRGDREEGRFGDHHGPVAGHQPGPGERAERRRAVDQDEPVPLRALERLPEPGQGPVGRSGRVVGGAGLRALDDVQLAGLRRRSSRSG